MMTKRTYFSLTDTQFFFLIFSLSVSGVLNGSGTILSAVAEIVIGGVICYFLRKYSQRDESVHINDAYAFSVCGACGAAFVPAVMFSSASASVFSELSYGKTAALVCTLVFSVLSVLFLTKGFIRSLDIIPYFALLSLLLTFLSPLSTGALTEKKFFFDPLLYPATVTAFFRTSDISTRRIRLIPYAFIAICSGAIFAVAVSLGAPNGFVYNIFSQVFFLLRCSLCLITAYSVSFVGRSTVESTVRNSVMFAAMCLVQYSGSIPWQLSAVLTNVPAALAMLRRRSLGKKRTEKAM